MQNKNANLVMLYALNQHIILQISKICQNQNMQSSKTRDPVVNLKLNSESEKRNYMKNNYLWFCEIAEI